MYNDSIILNLQQENAELKEINILLKVEIENLKKKIDALEVLNIKLQDKLNINSTNSNIPTSKDVYKIEKSKKPASSNKPGAQKGHNYNGYQLRVPDVIKEVLPDEDFCKCGCSLIVQDTYKTHQKIEIPEIKPIVTEYRLKNKVCNICKKKYRAKLDNYKILGKNVETIITSLTGFFNNSKREVQDILSQIFNLDISLGLISNSEGRVSDKLKNKYDELLNQAKNSSYLHIDETGHNNQGKRYWAWVVANKMVTVFKLANSRARKVIMEFIPEFTGDVITDRYAVYNAFGNNRQICLAHLARDFKRFSHSKNKKLSEIGSKLVNMTNEIFSVYGKYKENILEKNVYIAKIEEIKNQMFGYLNEIFNIPKAEQAHRISNNILKIFDMIWLFTKNDYIELTNNFAERQIKHHVKYRKNSFFTWSNRGDRFLERIKSVYSTAKSQKLNPVNILMDQLV
jgi:transposase